VALMRPEDFEIWKQSHGHNSTGLPPLKPSETPPENLPENPLERIAREGFDRTMPRPPHASVPLVPGKPIAKVAAAGVSGASVTVLVWALKTFLNFEIPPEVASAAAVLVAYLSAYFTPLKQRELVAR
jgi:hypothetical protein